MRQGRVWSLREGGVCSSLKWRVEEGVTVRSGRKSRVESDSEGGSEECRSRPKQRKRLPNTT